MPHHEEKTNQEKRQDEINSKKHNKTGALKKEKLPKKREKWKSPSDIEDEKREKELKIKEAREGKEHHTGLIKENQRAKLDQYKDRFTPKQ